MQRPAANPARTHALVVLAVLQSLLLVAPQSDAGSGPASLSIAVDLEPTVSLRPVRPGGQRSTSLRIDLAGFAAAHVDGGPATSLRRATAERMVREPYLVIAKNHAYVTAGCRTAVGSVDDRTVSY